MLWKKSRRLAVGLKVTAALLAAATALLAAAPVVDAQPVPPGQSSVDAEPALNELITGLALKYMPHSWERNKGWGAQTERWDGIHWERDGWKLKSRRRRKLVNDGTWRKYSATLADPQRQFSVAVTNIRATGRGTIAFQVAFSARLDLFARQALWETGVQLYSLSAKGSATVRLVIDIETSVSLDGAGFPPDVVFVPRATGTELIVDEFRIDRVSKLGGEFAQQVTRLARRELDDEIAEKEQELTEKLNREFKQHAEEFRLSLAKALKIRWAESAMPHLTPAVREAAGAVRH